jgi:hypothetical protein
VGHFGDHGLNQRRSAPTLPQFTGIGAPLQRNPHDIINSLRAFYKTGTPGERQMVDMKGTIEEMRVLLQTEAARYSVIIQTELESDIPNVVADRVQLQQVLMNLMLNGIEDERQRRRIDDQFRSRFRRSADRFHLRHRRRIADGKCGADFQSFSHDETTGDRYGIDDHPLNRGGIWRAGVGRRQSGRRDGFSFHSP